MKDICPTCGQAMPEPGLDADELYHVLKTGTPHREVYKTVDGQWFVTYGGGPTTYEAVQILIQQGKIRPVDNNCPTDAYHIGKTWDYERTMESRRKHGKHARQYFVGDP